VGGLMTVNKRPKDMGDMCLECRESTEWGSGRFVNRVPHDTETEEGYLCPECYANEFAKECDRCGDTIPIDEDISSDQFGLVAFEDGSQFVHAECLTKKELSQTTPSYFGNAPIFSSITKK
jgi:hypothetical protein